MQLAKHVHIDFALYEHIKHTLTFFGVNNIKVFDEPTANPEIIEAVFREATYKISYLFCMSYWLTS